MKSSKPRTKADAYPPEALSDWPTAVHFERPPAPPAPPARATSAAAPLASVKAAPKLSAVPSAAASTEPSVGPEDSTEPTAPVEPPEPDPEAGFACFPTELGVCAIAWGQRGITGAQLPEQDEAATRQRMQQRFPGVPERSPTEEATRAIAGVQAMLRGEPADFTDLRLDMDGLPLLHRRLYLQMLKMRPGDTMTYGELAAQLSGKVSARSVGVAMAANPFAPIVPCHRVLAAGGKHGGFSAPGGAITKLRMLHIEGAAPGGQGCCFRVHLAADHLHWPSTAATNKVLPSV